MSLLLGLRVNIHLTGPLRNLAIFPDSQNIGKAKVEKDLGADTYLVRISGMPYFEDSKAKYFKAIYAIITVADGVIVKSYEREIGRDGREVAILLMKEILQENGS